MQKMLPFSELPSETYQGLSFILGAVLGNDNSKQAYYNKYINLECANTKDIFQVELYFTRCMWGDYWKDNIAELDLYAIRNIAENLFVNFLRERIDQDNYILLYEIDEYYLSYSPNYRHKHFAHDTYILGYDDDYFLVMAYKDGKLQRIKLKNVEIVNALYKGDIGKEIEFCTFRIHPTIQVTFDVKKMYREFKNYYEGNGNDEPDDDLMVFGVNIYDVLISAIYNFIQDSFYSVIDLRPFRILWEHKKIIVDHIKKLGEIMVVPDIFLREFIEIENLTYSVFMVVLKYSVNKSKILLYDVISCLENISKREKSLLKSYISWLEGRVH